MESHGFQHRKNIIDGPEAEILKHYERLTIIIKKPSIQLLRLTTTTTNYESHFDDDDPYP